MQSSTSQIVGIQFKLFSSNEIEKLSVLPVTNIQTFDPLGHPLENSLADTALGNFTKFSIENRFLLIKLNS